MILDLNLPYTTSPELADFVKGWEKCRLQAYPDSGGVWTCGWGQTGADICRDVRWTQEEADARLAATLRDTARGLRDYIFRAPLQQQFDAMVSLAYNAGVHAIGVSGLMARFNSGLDQECALRFLLWNKDNGAIVPGLTKRREAEMEMYLNGDYSGRP